MHLVSESNKIPEDKQKSWRDEKNRLASIWSQTRSKARAADNRLTCWHVLTLRSADVPGSDGCLVPQRPRPSFTTQPDLPPQEKKRWKFPSEPLRVTPSVCACLSANASSFLKLGPPVGLQTLLTAHSHASLLPNSTSTRMRKEPLKFFSGAIFFLGARRHQRKLVKVVLLGGKWLD